MGYTMDTRCLKCGGELYNDTEFGMIQCMDCDWYTTNDEEIHKIHDIENGRNNNINAPTH